MIMLQDFLDRSFLSVAYCIILSFHHMVLLCSCLSFSLVLIVAFVFSLQGQAGAIRLGISRALETLNADFEAPLREGWFRLSSSSQQLMSLTCLSPNLIVGFLTRDPRVVERKKPGQRKARRKFQWYGAVWTLFCITSIAEIFWGVFNVIFHNRVKR